MSQFTTIVITSPEERDSENVAITELLKSEAADFVHIRKPGIALSYVKRLVEKIPADLHERLRLHDHFTLLDEFNMAGVHLNSRCMTPPKKANSLSKSCHSLDEISGIDSRFKYVTLSPIFDSISKQGYISSFNLEALKGKLDAHNVIALGGIIPEHFPVLSQTGFVGGAMLGYVWNHQGQIADLIKEILKYKEICCNI